MCYESLVISTKIIESLRLELLWDKLLEPLQKLKKSDHSKKSVNNEITSIENYLFYYFTLLIVVLNCSVGPLVKRKLLCLKGKKVGRKVDQAEQEEMGFCKISRI